jgi:starch phosphorylase
MDEKTLGVNASTSTQISESTETQSKIELIKQQILENLHSVQVRTAELATLNDWYMAVAHMVRVQMHNLFVSSLQQIIYTDVKVVSYLSAEFLMGPHLGNNLMNLGITDLTRSALEELGIDLDELIEHEEEPGLGNGGLGRLAACYMDSLACLEVPAIGYGIRYEFGIFDQIIQDGWQKEKTDKWLRLGNPWEICRPEDSYLVNFEGHTEHYQDKEGNFKVRWIPGKVAKGVCYDTPICSYKGKAVNVLRLWKSEAVESFDFEAFNRGNYYEAVDEKVLSETVSKVLYPNDEPEVGKRLRLAQQYFFVSCSLQDMIHIHLGLGKKIETFNESFTIQLNDTHPSIAVAELMRLLIDEYLLDWDTAWNITVKSLGYTNHTLLPEALEKWSLPLFKSSLPRHLEIIYEINRRFLDEVRLNKSLNDYQLSQLSLIDESGEKYVRMANLASVGSHKINGVAELHTNLLTQTVLKDLYAVFPERFVNVTNGVTPRRWIALSNPELSNLISGAIGDGWIKHFEDDIGLIEPLADDRTFQQEWRKTKNRNKTKLAEIIKQRTGIITDPDSMFDIQVKRFHEYKRQHLNILHVISLYNRIKKQPHVDVIPRTVIFGGKAAPGYFMAKLIIKLINSVGEVVNSDSDVAGRLRVIFFPDFNVKSAQHIYPAADLSEQISTAGKEASGTGNMKFSMNGALTIGTLDGANVEIREEVGPENFFLFGLNAAEVQSLRDRGYNPQSYYESNPHLKEAIDQIRSGFFSGGNKDLFNPLVENLLNHDPFMLLADYQSYLDCQDQVSKVYRDQNRWVRMSILNLARMGKFSSDRSIRDYCEKIWDVPVR